MFFEKSGKWYFYIHNNKSENYSKNNKCTGIYNAETGNMDYKLMVDTLDTCQRATDRIEFADNYYMVTTFGSAGSEPASFITNMSADKLEFEISGIAETTPTEYSSSFV